MNRTPEGPGKQWTISVQKVCCPQRNGGVVDQIKWTIKRTHALVKYSGARPCRHLYTSKASLYVIRYGKSSQWSVSCMAAETGARLGRESSSLAADRRTPCSRASDQLRGQTADRYSSLGDCGSVHERWRAQCRPSEIVESNADWTADWMTSKFQPLSYQCEDWISLNFLQLDKFKTLYKVFNFIQLRL